MSNALLQLNSLNKGGICARVMASEVDSELTSASTDPSSGSLLGDKTTGEGRSIHDTASSGHPHESQTQISVLENEKKTTLIPSSPQSGNDPQSESVKKEDKDNVDKPEKTGGESPVKMQQLEQTEKAGDINDRGDGFKHTDEADEDKDQDQDMVSDKPEPEPSLKEKTTLIPSSPQSGNDPQSESVIKEEKDNVDKPEKTGGAKTALLLYVGSSGDSARKEEDESPVKMQQLEQTEKAGDINDRGDGFKHTDEADEDKDQDQDMVSDKPEPEPSLKEKMTLIPSSPQSGNDPQSESVIKEDKDHVDRSEKTGGEYPVNIQRTNEDEMASDINERGEHTDEMDEMGENEDQDPVTEEPLQQNASSGLPQDNQAQISVGWNNKLFFAVLVLLVSYYVALYFSDSTPPVPKEFNVVDVFNQEMEKLKINFPNQRPELWRRSLIHIRRHLKTEQPTEPVSLILTSGHGAERTLDCLARCLAQAFSTARNSSFLNIDGKSKASQDSDQVKLDIDSELRNAFEGKKFAAVIHRFEELPPGSTLIFYRYCDHENAAYKNVFLAFTVMLEGEVEVPSSVNLGIVEEMVQEHVKQKFVSSDKLATFNQMDVDKLSGLWSRISHLILPVAAEKKIELQGCGDCDK